MNEELKVIIKAELGAFMSDMKKAISEVKNFGKASKKSSEELDGFVKEVNDQARALAKLKQEYINAAAAQGRTSQAAKDCEKRIKDLSKTYSENGKLMKELADYADSLDASLKDVGKNGKLNIDTTASGTDDGINPEDMKQLNKETSEFKDILQSIVALDFAGVIGNIFGPELLTGLKRAKNMLEGSKIEGFDIAFESLNPNSQLYKEIDWLGWGDAIKGFFERFGAGMKQAFKAGKEALHAIGKALSGTVGILLVLIADLAIFIGLWKNATKIAEEIKSINTEANKINMSTQAYSEWGYVLQQCGIDAERLTDFIKKLTEKQKEVLNGSNEVIGAFKELGLSQEEVVSMGQEELFAETVKRIQQIENATQRTSIAYRIFTDDAVHLNAMFHLTNDETAKLIGSYYTLGGAPSQRLIEQSLVLGGSLTNLKTAWGGLRNTLAEAFLPVVIKVVQWLTNAIAVVSLFMKAILGVDLGIKSMASAAAKGAVGGISKGANAMKNYNDKVKDTTNSIKELQRTTFGFDELNIMPKTNTGSDSDSSYIDPSMYGGGGFNTDIPIIETPDLSGLREWLNKYKDIIQQVATWSLIGIGVLLAVIGFGHGNVALGLLGVSLAGLGISIGSVEGGAFDDIAKAVKNCWSGIKEWFNNDVKPIFTKAFWEEKWNQVNEATGGKLNEIKAKIEEKWNGIKQWFNDNVKPIFTKAYWSEQWSEFRTAWNEGMDNVKAKINEKWQSVKTWFNENVKPIFTRDYWTKKFDNMRLGAQTALANLKAKITDSWVSIKNWFSKNVKSKFTVEYWQGVFSSIKDGAKSAFNGVIGVVESAVNFIIRKINTLSWTIPDWVPKIGGDKFGFNFREIAIPRLAKGGIATRSTIANIGEAGKEAVLPLERNTEWIDMLADRLAARSNTPSKISLIVDGKELGWASIRNINEIAQQIGELPFVVV